MFIIYNKTNESIELSDFGITIPSLSQYPLHERTSDYRDSNELLSHLYEGTLCVIVDGQELSPSDSVRSMLARGNIPLSPSGEVVVSIPKMRSEVGEKLWVHNSAKPQHDGKQYYVFYTGSGDCLGSNTIGCGDPLSIEILSTDTTVTKTLEFVSGIDSGEVYLHDAYFMVDNAGLGDCFSVGVRAHASELQTVANLDLILELTPHGNIVKPSPDGPGTGTHGFAATPVLIKSNRYKGNWDYSSATGLVPNLSGTGKFVIMDTDVLVNTFVNKIPVYGTSTAFTSLRSNDTAWIPPGYYIEITAFNQSGQDWKLIMFTTLFREFTTTTGLPF